MNFVRIGPHDGKLFDSLMKKDNYSFVKFYSPTCFHCNEMAPQWDALQHVKKPGMKKNFNIIDVHVGAIPNIKSECSKNIVSVPTIMEVKPGGIPGRQYNGPRTLPGFLKFINHTLSQRKKKTRRVKPMRTKKTRRVKPMRTKKTRRVKPMRTKKSRRANN